MARNNGRILMARVGWMRYYGRINDAGDRLVGGGSWNDHEQGSELCNFKPIRGRLLGFVRSGPALALNLRRIDADVSGQQPELPGVTVIFVATDQGAPTGTERHCIIGWYRNATVYRSSREDPTGLRGASFYNLGAGASDAVLLPRSLRTHLVPRGKKGAMGQSNVWYPLEEDGKPRRPRWLVKALDYVQAYRGDNLVENPEADLIQATETEIEKAAGFESDQRIRSAVEDHAMKMVERHYRRRSYKVTDRHKTHPYDFECASESRKCYVEVKGTRTTGDQILLTSNEAELPYRRGVVVDLCVVHSIKVADGKKIVTSGGKLDLYENWRPRDHGLRPISFICEMTKG